MTEVAPEVPPWDPSVARFPEVDAPTNTDVLNALAELSDGLVKLEEKLDDTLARVKKGNSLLGMMSSRTAPKKKVA